ncbi:MAG TPA: hypothetical protein VHK05_06625 [Candidatus Limnocylindrales bacterium]|jgi:hypothetical protein|nr:hypothetical protein [Candidatus Limnocylindrales bacterium]
MRGILVAAIAVVVGTGCGSLDFQRPGSVVIYGRAAPLDQSWFGLVPPGDPPSVVGFGSDGVGCLDGSPGTQVAWYDGSPAQGGKPRQIIGRIPADGASLVLWVEIVDEGRLEFGQGVPDWWVGEPQTC